MAIGYGTHQIRLFTSSKDESGRIYDITSGSFLLEVTFSVPLSSVAIDSTESNVFYGTFNGDIHTFSLTSPPRDLKTMMTKSSSNTFVGHASEVGCLSVSLDGLTLASGSTDHTVKLWHVQSKQCVRTLNHKDEITNLLFLSPPPPGMVQPVDYKPNLTISQLAKTTNPNLDDNYVLEIYTRTDDNEDIEQDEPREYSDETIFSSSRENNDEEIERLKKINCLLYKSAVEKLLK